MTTKLTDVNAADKAAATPPPAFRLYSAIVANELRTHGGMSPKRADELAQPIVAALAHLGWLRMPTRSPDHD